MKNKILVFLLMAASIAVANDIEISNIYAKATPPGAKNSAIFFDIKNNTDKPIKLIGASSPISQTGEIHTHKEIDGMKKMIQIDEIAIPAMGETSLRPGGLHIMLMNIHKPLKEGDKIEATFKFDNGIKIDVKNIAAKSIIKSEQAHKGH